jgi:hypothetical protein
MNIKKVVLAAVAAWVVSMALGYVVNIYLLARVTLENAAAMRPEAELMAKLPIGFVGLLFGFLAVAYMYAMAHPRGGGPAAGAVFGLLIATLAVAFGLVWVYVQFPVNVKLLVVGIVDVYVEMAIYGAIIGAIYKPK